MEDKNTLDRFISAQKNVYNIALAELESGKKRSHWMWFIFPQIAGLGTTDTSKFYSIKDITEARDYLMHPQLGLNLTRCCQAILKQATNDPHNIFGSPDDLKLKSSITLFDAVPDTFSIFNQVLEKFYNGKRDQRTLELLDITN